MARSVGADLPPTLGLKVVMIRKVISGGQTGADQAGLDAALQAGIEHGGLVPKGRRTESGRLPEKYRLDEDTSRTYRGRTLKNVLAADGTVVFAHGKLTGGSRLTREYARKNGKPCLCVNLNSTKFWKAVERLEHWIVENRINVLNVAGPRASKDPEIYQEVFRILQEVFQRQ